VAPGSPADSAGITVNDEIGGINGHALQRNFHDWCGFYGHSAVTLTLLAEQREKAVTLISVPGKEYFPSFYIIKQREASEAQKKAYMAWAGREY